MLVWSISMENYNKILPSWERMENVLASCKGNNKFVKKICNSLISFFVPFDLLPCCWLSLDQPHSVFEGYRNFSNAKLFLFLLEKYNVAQ